MPIPHRLLRRSALLIATCILLVSSAYSQADSIRHGKTKRGRDVKVAFGDSTHRSFRAVGVSASLSTYGHVRSSITLKQANVLSAALFDDFEPVFGLSPRDLTHAEVEHGDGLLFIRHQQTYSDIPVFGTDVGYSVNEAGDVIALGGYAFPDVDVATTPVLTSAEATVIAREAFARDSIVVEGDARLVIYPDSAAFRLTWCVELSSSRPVDRVVFFVDAIDGTLAHRFSRMRDVHAAPAAVAPNDSVLTFPVQMSPSLVPANLLAYVTFQGTTTVKYYPLHDYDTPTYANFPSQGITVDNALGQNVMTFNANSNGSYSASGNLAAGGYYVNFPLQTQWVRMHEYVGNIWVNDPINYDYSIVPNAVNTINHLWSDAIKDDATYEAMGDASNVAYHVHKVHDIFKAYPFNHSGVDYQMKAHVNQGSNVNGRADGTELYFGSQLGYKWARAADVIYHEYSHNVIFSIYGQMIGDQSSGVTQGDAMDEGLSDYFANSITHDAVMGESVGVNRTLVNNYTWTPASGAHWNGQVIGGAVWDLRSAVGKEKADRLAFQALKISPRAYDFATYGYNMVVADYQYYGGANESAIRSAFQGHGISIPTFSPPPSAPTSVSVSGTLGTHPYITWSGSTGATGYKVYRCSYWYYTCSSYSYIGMTGSTSYTDVNKVVGNGCIGNGDDIT